MSKIRLNRIVLYVRDVERLSEFYRQAFAFSLGQHIEGEWAVLQTGACELGLHVIGPKQRPPAEGWTGDNSNAKLVFTLDEPIEDVRERLVKLGIEMGPVRSYPGITGPLCDGRDPEGNVFQLAQDVPPN